VKIASDRRSKAQEKLKRNPLPLPLALPSSVRWYRTETSQEATFRRRARSPGLSGCAVATDARTIGTRARAARRKAPFGDTRDGTRGPRMCAPYLISVFRCNTGPEPGRYRSGTKKG
jgi:hypothetical protein